MEMHQIRYFLALCEERNFTRTAKRCGVSQPSLTNAIKRLEQTLGGPLFHRDRGNINLTELGRVIKPYLIQLDQSAYEAKRTAEEFLSSRHVNKPRTMEASMRAHYAIAVVAVLVVGFGAEQYLFPPHHAEAGIGPISTASLDIAKMHRDIDIGYFPMQKMNDKTSVFIDEE
jgi:Mn-dependent DtxR family transcriptional regulator